MRNKTIISLQVLPHKTLPNYQKKIKITLQWEAWKTPPQSKGQIEHYQE